MHIRATASEWNLPKIRCPRQKRIPSRPSASLTACPSPKNGRQDVWCINWKANGSSPAMVSPWNQEVGAGGCGCASYLWSVEDESEPPDLGDEWRYGCPKSPIWESGDEKDPKVGSDSASVTSLRYVVYEHNKERGAIEVIGQDLSGDVVALFLADWELGRVASSCHVTMDLLCQEMRDAYWDRSESLGSPVSLCSQCQAGKE